MSEEFTQIPVVEQGFNANLTQDTPVSIFQNAQPELTPPYSAVNSYPSAYELFPQTYSATTVQPSTEISPQFIIPAPVPASELETHTGDSQAEAMMLD